MQAYGPRFTGWGAALALAAALPAAGAPVVPIYNSYPGRAEVVLDFDGDVTPTWGIYAPGVTPAYDIDGNPDTFSPQELENIQRIWQGVAEKFSPFNLNVTTVDAGHDANGYTERIVIGGSGDWAPAGAGGISIDSAFVIQSRPNVAFVFPDHLGNGNPRYVAEAVAHEAGHAFGLAHQSLYDASGTRLAVYHPGNADRAPIMGKSYFATRGTWANGATEESPSIFQDNLRYLGLTDVTLANNFGYRPDDHGDAPAEADPLALGANFSISGQGVIETMADADFFSFTTPGGAAHLVADVAPFAPMLDLSLGLYDEAGTLLAMKATPSLGEVIDHPLAPGNYTLGVFSAGVYGDIGQYSISGSAVPEPASLPAVLALFAPVIARRRGVSAPQKRL